MNSKGLLYARIQIYRGNQEMPIMEWNARLRDVNLVWNAPPGQELVELEDAEIRRIAWIEFHASGIRPATYGHATDRRAALEEAAKACEEYAINDASRLANMQWTASECARRIRALIDGEGK